MSVDEQPISLPALYGAPAYARPPAPVAPTPRPFDPDRLPLEVFRTEDDDDFLVAVPAHAYQPSGASSQSRADGDLGNLRPRVFSLRAIAGRLLRGR